MKQHIAILTPGWIPFLLDGTKTIESRFTKTRCAPFNQVREGDLIYLKESGGLILGSVVADRVDTFENLTKEETYALFKRYKERIFTDNLHFNTIPVHWNKARYATLIHVRKPVTFTHPVTFKKRDPRAWVVLPEDLDIGENNASQNDESSV